MTDELDKTQGMKPVEEKKTSDAEVLGCIGCLVLIVLVMVALLVPLIVKLWKWAF